MENGSTLSRKYTTYERDGNGRDQAMQRSYHAWFSRFDQPDPFDGSYDLTNPQTLNRYAYVNNDPINFVDPSGLFALPEKPTDSVSGIWGILIHFNPRGGGRPIRPRLVRLPEPRGHLELIDPQEQPVYCLPEFIEAMKTAWGKTGNGTNGSEAGFAGVKVSKGFGKSNWATRELPFTNQKKNDEGRENLSFAWSGSYQSIWHVHSKGGPPSDVDQNLANKRQVPVYSFGRNGLYLMCDSFFALCFQRLTDAILTD